MTLLHVHDPPISDIYLCHAMQSNNVLKWSSINGPDKRNYNQLLNKLRFAFTLSWKFDAFDIYGDYRIE